eukprot:2909912-Amphidinium_carterae.1
MHQIDHWQWKLAKDDPRLDQGENPIPWTHSICLHTRPGEAGQPGPTCCTLNAWLAASSLGPRTWDYSLQRERGVQSPELRGKLPSLTDMEHRFQPTPQQADPLVDLRL